MVASTPTRLTLALTLSACTVGVEELVDQDAGRTAGAEDAATRDVGTADAGPTGARLVVLTERVDVGAVPLGGRADFGLRLRVEAGEIDLRTVTFRLEDGAGWRLLCQPTPPSILRPEVERRVPCRVVRDGSPRLDGRIVIDAQAAGAGEVPIVGRATSTPLELFEPEDIGFGPVELGRAARIRAYFDRPVTIGPTPPELQITDVSEVASPFPYGIELLFTPNRAARVRAQLTVDGRAVPVSGIGARSPLRAVPSRLRLPDLPPGACATATVTLGNPGTAPAALDDLRVSGTGASFRRRGPVPATIAPFEVASVAVDVCGERLGPIRGELAQAGEVVASIAAEGRGPEVGRRGPIRPGALIVNLPRIVTATVSNPGAAPATWTGFRVDGPDAAAVDILSSALVVPPRRTVEIALRVTPRRPGPLRATLVARVNAANGPEARISIAGTVEASDCDLVPDRAILDVGATPEPGVRTDWIAENRGGDCAVLWEPPATSSTPPPAFRAPSWGAPWDEGRRVGRIGRGGRLALPLGLATGAVGQVFEARGAVLAADPAGRRELPVVVRGVRVVDGLFTDVRYEPGCIDETTTAAALKFDLQSTVAASVTELRVRALGASGIPNLPALPLTLSPNAGREVAMSFVGAPAGNQPVEVSATYRVAGETRRLRQVRTVAFSPRTEQIDAFEQLSLPKIDILMVVDGSASMDDIENVEDNVAYLMTELVRLDSQIAFTSADASLGGSLIAARGQAPMLFAADPEFSARALRNFAAARAAARSQLEQPLDAALLAVENWLEQGSLRRDARLLVIMLGDEDDASPGSPNLASGRFFSVKGFRNTNLFTSWAVAGREGDACISPETAEPAPRLRGVAENTGGILASPCLDDWARSFEIRTRGGSRSRFILTNEPDPGSIRVSVDGVDVPARGASGESNWSYDLFTNSVNFALVAEPGPGARIVARYRPVCP